MSVATGQEAPDFTLHTHEGEPFTLSEHQGKPVLLLFFPGAFTSVCTTELNTVNNQIEDFGGEDVTIAGISTDSPFVLDEFREVHGFTFPLLSDHNATVSERYGAKYDRFTDMELDRIAKRAAFVVGEDGVLQYAEVLDNAGNLPDFDAIQDVLNNHGSK